MKIYLAGPIAGCSDSQCRDWREQVKKALPWAHCLDPLRRDYRGRETGNAADIIRYDTFDIAESDVFLMYFPFPSVGTSMELLIAHRWFKIPCIVVSHYQGQHSPWLYHHSDHVFEDFSTAYKWIEEYHALNP